MPKETEAETRKNEEVLDDQVNVAMPKAMKAKLLVMKQQLGLPLPEMGRKLYEAAIQFYEQHGTFGFPVLIYPKASQAAYISELKQWLAEDLLPVKNEIKIGVAAETAESAALLPSVAGENIRSAAPIVYPTRPAARASSKTKRREKL
jgi:hypothetical protein